MKLYGSKTSPFVRKVRVLVAEKGLACPFVVAEPRTLEGPVQRLSPLGKVPVLELDDGQVLYDSPVVAEYLDALAEPAFLPPPGAARWDVLRVQALADGLMEATVARLLELRRPEPQRSLETLAWEERRADRALAAADALVRAAHPSPWLVDDRMTLADIALAAALAYVDFRRPHPWRDRHPALGAWLEPIAARPSFRDTVPQP